MPLGSLPPIRSSESQAQLLTADNRQAEARNLRQAACEKFGTPPAFIDRAKSRSLRLHQSTRHTKQLLIRNVFGTQHIDQEDFLARIRQRMDQVGVDPCRVEVRFQNLTIEAQVQAGNQAAPSVANSYTAPLEGCLHKLKLHKASTSNVTILKDITGVLLPGRFTLLLGPPGSGKSMLLKALAGKLQKTTLKTQGVVTYNGSSFDTFLPERTAAYINQTDIHLPELTVRETLDFSARCQGIGNKDNVLKELRKREAELGIEPDCDIDAFMTADTAQGKRENLVSELTMHLLGLDVCADIAVGNQDVRGISGGQRKRVTTGEMIVGPKKTLFMDEISTGLDSSTTFQIVKCLRDFAHMRQATVLISLLQPPPETYNLFDDVLLLSQGQVLFHGAVDEVVPFFGTCGFTCPARKNVPDWLQELTSQRDQQQYWSGAGQYQHVPATAMVKAFRASPAGQRQAAALVQPCDKALYHTEALVFVQQGLTGLQAFKALMRREVILVQRNSFLYVFKVAQMIFTSIIAATLFLRTHIAPDGIANAHLYAGFLFFATLQMIFNGIAEMTFTIERIAVFFKQRDDLFFPVWSYVLPTSLVRLPVSLLESLIWVVIVYYPVGLSPNPDRFFMNWLLLFLIHNMAISLFRALGALARNIVIANALGALVLMFIIMLGGFVLPRGYVHPWWIWGYWIDPLQYGMRALLVNEFTAPRWNMPDLSRPGVLLGQSLLNTYDFPGQYWWVWLGVGVQVACIVLFNIITVYAHKLLQPIGTTPAVQSDEGARQGLSTPTKTLDGLKASDAVDCQENLACRQGSGLKDGKQAASPDIEQGSTKQSKQGLQAAQTPGSLQQDQTVALPFTPLTMTFDDVHYLVDLPKDMKDTGAKAEELGAGTSRIQLELLQGINGAFVPRVLTCLMGVSGAGKTTLMDVLAGRKTSGKITGDIHINGHPKQQATFARVSGYVEQSDVHSPQTTVREALLFSASLRIDPSVPADRINAFVEEMLGLVELHSLQNALVGTPGVSGLSVEQRKRLTIAVELVANPSIVFMDEPTSGLDARAAAIVMRTVRNIANTGRTIVCTIHQPSIDIFESFDELLLLKRGGQTIYAGPLGKHSVDLVRYFEEVPGIDPISITLNPATWMLEVTTPGNEKRLGVDFAEIYSNSSMFRRRQQLIAEAMKADADVPPLHFATKYACGAMRQYLVILHKFSSTYWRNPSYNATRFTFTLAIAIVFGTTFWKLGNKTESEQDLTNTLGALYTSTVFLGVMNSIFVQPVVFDERSVSYRERAAGMYSVQPWYLAMASVEALYLCVQAILYTCTVYFMAGFARDAGKFFWFLLFMMLTLMFFTFYGIVCVAMTASLLAAAVVSNSLYVLMGDLFSGFIIPQPHIPGWWIGAYYMNPVAWSLHGLIASNVGDYDARVVQLAAGGQQSVPDFLLEQYGYRHDWIGWVVVVLAAFVVLFWGMGAVAFKVLHFRH